MVVVVGLLVLSVVISGRGSEAGEISLWPSPLTKIAEQLMDADQEQRADFARIAVQEMIAEYSEVASEARRDSSPRRAGRRARWSGAVEHYVVQLRQTLQRIERREPIGIAPGDGGTVRLRIGDQPLIVSGPRLDRPDGLVWRIVERYCALALCPEDGFDGPAAAPLPHGVWSYGEDQGPTLSTPQGVHCVFADLSNRLRKELFCRGLVRDLETMASALLAASGLGFLVDWSKIEIARSVEADRQTVTVNALGDYLRLHLPVLVRVPALRDDALQWVRRRVSSRPASWLVVDADRFLGRGGLDE